MTQIHKPHRRARPPVRRADPMPLDLRDPDRLHGKRVPSPAVARWPTATLPCREESNDLWFSESTNVLEHAKALCRRCPIREACLAGALARAEPWGVWGGEIFQEGAVIARKRPRGRPPKYRAAG